MGIQPPGTRAGRAAAEAAAAVLPMLAATMPMELALAWVVLAMLEALLASPRGSAAMVEVIYCREF